MNAKPLFDLSNSPLSSMAQKESLRNNTKENNLEKNSPLEKENDFKSSLREAEKTSASEAKPKENNTEKTAEKTNDKTTPVSTNSSDDVSDEISDTTVEAAHLIIDESVGEASLQDNQEVDSFMSVLNTSVTVPESNKIGTSSDNGGEAVATRLLGANVPVDISDVSLDDNMPIPTAGLSSQVLGGASSQLSAPLNVQDVTLQGSIIQNSLSQNSMVQVSLPVNLTTTLSSVVPAVINKLTIPAASADSLLSSLEQESTQLLPASSTCTLSTGIAQSITTPANSASPIPQLPMNAAFGSERWGSAVTERVMWMSSQGLKEASIRLDPPELGSMAIKISMSAEQTHVSFTVQHASVREALDQNSLRLREMFAQEGLDLTDVDVSDQSSSEQYSSDSDEERQYSQQALVSGSDSDANNETVHTVSIPTNLVDSYV